MADDNPPGVDDSDLESSQSSESTTGSDIYNSEPYVVYNINSDQPKLNPEQTEKQPRTKKKTKKKTKQAEILTSESSSSAFEDSLDPTNVEPSKEEYYDAQSSISRPDSLQVLVAMVVEPALAHVQSRPIEEPKVPGPSRDQGNSVHSSDFKPPQSTKTTITKPTEY